MGYTKQTVEFENLPKWDWEEKAELECKLLKTREGSGKADGLVFHEVENVLTNEKFSLLGNTVLDRIFEEAGDRRVKIDYKGMAKGKNNRQYKSFDWYIWEEDAQ